MSRQIAEQPRASTKPHELRRAFLRCQDQKARSARHAAIRIRGGEIYPIGQTQHQLLSRAARTCGPTRQQTVAQAAARALLLGLGPIRPGSTSIGVTVFVARMPCALVARVSRVPHSQDIDRRTSISVARGRSQCLMMIGLACRYQRGVDHRIGSGVGIRTLNIAVNRSAQPVQRSRFEFAERR